MPSRWEGLPTTKDYDKPGFCVRLDPKTSTLQKSVVRPRKSDITVDALGLVWIPYWQDSSGALTGAWG